jgi:hypothetical protein
MTLETLTKADDDTQIRGLLDDWAQAARSGDIDAIMAHYAPDMLAFDAIAQLQFKGAEAYRKHWQACMEMCSGPMIFEMHNLSVTAGRWRRLQPLPAALRGNCGRRQRTGRMDARHRLSAQEGREVDGSA